MGPYVTAHLRRKLVAKQIDHLWMEFQPYTCTYNVNKTSVNKELEPHASKCKTSELTKRSF